MPTETTHRFNVGDIVGFKYGHPELRLIPNNLHDHSFTFGGYTNYGRVVIETYNGLPFETGINLRVVEDCLVLLTPIRTPAEIAPLPDSTPSVNSPIETAQNCRDCGLAFLVSELTTCQDDEVRCRNCYRVHTRHLERDYEGFDIPERDYCNRKYISRTKLRTKVLQSNRGFGVEIEAYANNMKSMVQIADNIDDRIGISHDGSLDTNNRGFELQFPLINGKNGEAMVNETCKVLNEHATVNGTCGYHVHLQSRRNEHSFAFIQRLMFVALVFDDVIMSFLPKSRRNNRYCMSLRNYISIDKVVETCCKEQLESVWYKDRNLYNIRSRKQGKYDDTRYHGFNFHCYLSTSKHLEIRHHTGTLNPTKILHWANLHLLLLDFVKNEVESCENLDDWFLKRQLINIHDRNFGDASVMKAKTKMFFDLIGLSREGREYFLDRQKKNNG